MTTVTWHPIDPATIPRGRRIMLWFAKPYDNQVTPAEAQFGYVVNRKLGLRIVSYLSSNAHRSLERYSHWAECPAGPNGETA